ncbi:ABC transporter ATP-binding protein [Chitinimonas taiwanensis]|uniref:Multiple sugar transport system ATP-binding protein n=1 Tax=Chitinimonas taiwanensis DSM 18899 TaxID=1121279 RepID=A0A1K2HGR6_9NEIS|nr:sn-glycerol-3-phosphate ABC transporter ATP-binding protein UgpC [Chitinimonas taiwanensis]SFZ75466.1 multiple sugar transport system ATP-binding protein [Chitinimonas taiwanensis DSM 18899]
MAHLSLRNLSKRYDNNPPVIENLNLDIHDGEFMVFVGPSGCGKSTLMRMIAGLEEISAGELHIGGELANDTPPAERGVAMVFQSYALYPHMTVGENMGFALKLAGKSKQEVAQAVGRAAEILQISHLLERKPKALSGGQRQRVAIGRAIVRKPKVFLFDEPLSNLDASLRVQMRIELSKLHKELGTTMIYVTHDQVEAMTLGDRIAVFNQGRMEQLGAPLELYERPANQFVAGFLGSPKMNFVPCQLKDASSSEITLSVAGDNRLVLPSSHTIAARGDITLGVRPEHLHIVPLEQGFRARVDLLEHLGDAEIVYLELAGSEQPIAIKLPSGGHGLKQGDLVGLRPDAARAVLFGKQGQAIRLQ